MTSVIKNTIAVELTEDELDTVHGGLSISLGDGQGFASDASNTFTQEKLAVGQQTFAGPHGSGTISLTNLEKISTSAELCRGGARAGAGPGLHRRRGQRRPQPGKPAGRHRPADDGACGL